jgi:hypothetical protein
MAPAGEGSGLIGAFSPPLTVGEICELPSEMGPVYHHHTEEHPQQRVLGVERGAESRRQAVQEGEGQEEEQVRAAYFRLASTDDRSDANPLRLAPLHSLQGR